MKKVSVLWRWGIVAGIVVLGLLACLQLRVSNDIVDLLPGEAVRGDIKQLQRMGLVNRLFITLSVSEKITDNQGATKKALQQSAAKLGDKLVASGNFSYVLSRLPEGYESALFSKLQASLPLLVDQGDKEDLIALTSPEGIKAGLEKGFALLNSPTGIALKRQVQLDPLGFVPLVLRKLNHLRSEFSMRIEDGFFMSRDGRSCLLVAESLDSLTDSHRAQVMQRFLDDAYLSALEPGVEARVIGSLPHTLANSTTIQRDLQLLLPAATVLLFFLLFCTLRDVRAIVVFGVPFLASAPAIGLTGLVYGSVSGISLAFGIVLLGITVDYPIHLYVSLVEGGGKQRDTLQELKIPLLFAALTTLAVFVVMLFSQVASHRQMALLSISGVIFAWAFSWLLIPTITKVSRVQIAQPAGHWFSPSFVSKFPGCILTGWLVLLLLGVLSWPRLHYNGDLRTLDARDNRVVEGEKHFAATWGERVEQAFIVAEGTTLAEVLDRNAQVNTFLQMKNVANFQSFAPILPGPATQQRNRQAWQQFWAGIRPDFDKRFIAEAAVLGFSEQAFAPFFVWLDSEAEKISPETFLGGPLQPLIASMLKIPPTTGGGGDGKYLAMTTVAVDDKILDTLLQFAHDEPQVTVLANVKWRAEVERLLRHDMLSLSLAAGLIILLLVAVQYRHIRAVAAALVPVLSALAAMSIFCYLTDRQLNMMHLIMGIMVIGMSVDYGIFIVSAHLGGKTSARAVTLCAISTLIGFGVLAFAGHPALHSLGITVLIGIGVSWPTALLVSPAILAIGKRN